MISMDKPEILKNVEFTMISPDNIIEGFYNRVVYKTGMVRYGKLVME
ncbi:MAG: hypothetical protein JXR41_07390 [Bacteroidales bacterium]|nr:hypothetical protein [Bacteroidales bacterium]MBN2762896.1 hypothetical protein [Bacteroidales bacterium]